MLVLVIVEPIRPWQGEKLQRAKCDPFRSATQSVRWPNLLLLLALLLTTSCGGDDDDGNGSPTGSENPEGSRMAATIDGQSWSADFIAEVRQGGIIASEDASRSAGRSRWVSDPQTPEPTPL